MSGQKMMLDEKVKIADEFIESLNFYRTPQSLKFDLRKYSKYIRDNNIKEEDVPESVVNECIIKND
ncbi:hypothetical protein SAMN02910369_02952 [Lachnospiraceae bacterium NE2001]|nr:hypothetical protein SAMN02910369_02952 [Lachnospiraceae bacterium NE2001]